MSTAMLPLMDAPRPETPLLGGPGPVPFWGVCHIPGSAVKPSWKGHISLVWQEFGREVVSKQWKERVVDFVE